MGRSSRIYIDGFAPDRKNNITGGSNERINLSVFVGTSSTHSRYMGALNIECWDEGEYYKYVGWFGGIKIFEETFHKNSKQFESVYSFLEKEVIV